jgi:hypothetical protein
MQITALMSHVLDPEDQFEQKNSMPSPSLIIQDVAWMPVISRPRPQSHLPSVFYDIKMIFYGLAGQQIRGGGNATKVGR